MGIVQGVGFRPFVYKLARKLGLTGNVANTGDGVKIQISGHAADIETFLDTLKTDPPPLARIFEIQFTAVQETKVADDFTIVPSNDSGIKSTLISPDIATCEDCINDISSPENHRFHYPFTNCTNCGPRMTIIRGIPYDRTKTSMAVFPMCPSCLKEYHDPSDRRFHAQPNACPACGPVLSWHDNQGTKISDTNEECLKACSRALQQGAIVAIKGLGGFHLAVDATSNKAVQRLRENKHRYTKPLAVMVANITTAEKICQLNDKERELLLSKERPIVLVLKKQSYLSDKLSPRIREIGIMLAYTPLHHLLFAMEGCPEILVMTSGNLSGEPICTDNRAALQKLATIADYFLLHNRDIVTRVDDSVVRIVRGRLQMIRRSRGYAPVPLSVPGLKQSVLACGAEQKNTFCLSRNGQFFLSQHIGDLKGPDTIDFFEESLDYMKSILDISPEQIVCDLHPDYLSSRYAAASSSSLPGLNVQHHHAHAAAIMAEHNLSEGLAVIFDGAGLGDDGTVWGGEILHVVGTVYERVGHLAPLMLPGGDRATHEIWRMGLAFLSAGGFDISKMTALPSTLRDIPAESLPGIAMIMEKKINTPLTSSVGRLFDAVSSLLDIRQEVDFEGQAAMELETLAWTAHESKGFMPDGDRYIGTIVWENQQWLLDLKPLLLWLLADLKNGTPVAAIALFFHLWLVRSTHKALMQLFGKRYPTQNIILGGGCFQNRMLLEFLAERLEKNDFNVYTGEQVPVNDGGISLGQACIAVRQTENSVQKPNNTN
jgi:hydrogenase maturation protein HypF